MLEPTHTPFKENLHSSCHKKMKLLFIKANIHKKIIWIHRIILTPFSHLHPPGAG